MFVFGFFLNSFVTCHKDIRFFSVLFVAVSHCDKELFCLLHWATAANRFFVCCTESLWQTKFIYDPWKNTKWAQKFYIFWYFFPFWELFATFWHFVCPFLYFFLKILQSLAFCVQYIPILFVAVTQWNKQKIYLSQWLSETNKTNLCYSDSMQQTI